MLFQRGIDKPWSPDNRQEIQEKTFDISNKYVKIIVPFDSKVMASVDGHVGNNVGNNVGNSGDNNEVMQSVISCILEDASINAAKCHRKQTFHKEPLKEYLLN